jgi:hypothetical protein
MDSQQRLASRDHCSVVIAEVAMMMMMMMMIVLMKDIDNRCCGKRKNRTARLLEGGTRTMI